MPSIDKRTGKPVGGAAKARKKKAQLEAERKRKPAKTAEVVQIGPQPESTADLVTWSARGLAAVAYRAAQDRTIFLTELDQLRFLADTFAKIGLVRDKSAEQERIRRLAEASGKVPSSKPEGAKPLAGGSKPPTAR